MAEFIRRWDSLKRSAREDVNKQRELDESLRSLGLRPPRDTLRQGDRRDDVRRSNADDALRTAPPQRYFEQFNAFRKGVSRSEERPAE